MVHIARAGRAAQAMLPKRVALAFTHAPFWRAGANQAGNAIVNAAG
jgi:hypothetical protein